VPANLNCRNKFLPEYITLQILSRLFHKRAWLQRKKFRSFPREKPTVLLKQTRFWPSYGPPQTSDSGSRSGAISHPLHSE
jgi:hypothetical protein